MNVEEIYHNEGLNPSGTQDQVYTRPESRVRLNTVKKFLDRALRDFDRPARFLEIGCAEGLYCDYVKNKAGVIVGVDISMPKLERAYHSQRLVYVQQNWDSRIFPANHFDIVLCSESIEHAEHPEVLLENLKHYAPRAILTVPLNEPHGANPNHLTTWTAEKFKEFIGGKINNEHVNEKPNFIALDVTWRD